MNKSEISEVISKHCAHLEPVRGTWTKEKITPIRAALKKAEQELKEKLDRLQINEETLVVYASRITDALADETRYLLRSS